MNLEKIIDSYLNLGYKLPDAVNTAGQEIILLKISKTTFKNNITVKGGIVLHNISHSVRRVTQDIDIDFIRYSLTNGTIKEFINSLNNLNDGIKILIDGAIEELSHQDYKGKRVYIKIVDNYNNTITSKLDIGVHKEFNIKQEEYAFNINAINESICLLINSIEQIFTEKLKSFLKFGFRSTRYKDLFDFYYLINNDLLDITKLINIMDILIFKNKDMYENNMEDVLNRIKNIFNSKIYLKHLNNSKYNWLNVPINDVKNTLINFIIKLKNINIKTVVK